MGAFIHFKIRIDIEKMFYEWCEKNNIAKQPNSMVVFMMEKNWLNEDKIVKDISKQTERDIDE